jgi:hypothetical protein
MIKIDIFFITLLVFVSYNLGATHFVLGGDALLDLDAHAVGEASLYVSTIVGFVLSLALDDIDEG